MFPFKLILVGEHDGDGRGRVVHVNRASGGAEGHQAGRVLVGVPDVERYRNADGASLGAGDGEAEHPDDIPEAAGFVLAGDTGRDGDALLVNSAGDEDREADAGFLRGFADVDLEAVGDGLGAGVGVNGRPEIGLETVCICLFHFVPFVWFCCCWFNR